MCGVAVVVLVVVAVVMVLVLVLVAAVVVVVAMVVVVVMLESREAGGLWCSTGKVRAKCVGARVRGCAWG